MDQVSYSNTSSPRNEFLCNFCATHVKQSHVNVYKTRSLKVSPSSQDASAPVVRQGASSRTLGVSCLALNSFWLQQQNLTITIIPTDSTLWNETRTEIELASCESKASNFNKGNMTGQLVPLRGAPVTEWQQPQKNTLDETDSPFKLNQVQDRAAPRSKWRPIPAYPHTSWHTVGRRSPEHGIWLQRKNEGYEMEIHGLLEQICKSEEFSWKFSKTRLENYKSSRLRAEQWLQTKKLHANAQWLESQEIPNNASKSPLVRMDGQNSRK